MVHQDNFSQLMIFCVLVTRISTIYGHCEEKMDSDHSGLKIQQSIGIAVTILFYTSNIYNFSWFRRKPTDASESIK